MRVVLVLSWSVPSCDIFHCLAAAVLGPPSSLCGYRDWPPVIAHSVRTRRPVSTVLCLCGGSWIRSLPAAVAPAAEGAYLWILEEGHLVLLPQEDLQSVGYSAVEQHEGVIRSPARLGAVGEPPLELLVVHADGLGEAALGEVCSLPEPLQTLGEVLRQQAHVWDVLPAAPQLLRVPVETGRFVSGCHFAPPC